MQLLFMVFEIGILFALGALVSWGFGDFLIQRTTRRLGDWETLLVISLFGVLMLAPFMYNSAELGLLFSDNLFYLLLGMSVVLLFAAILDFEALKEGKIAVVEPVYALEVPVTAIFAFFVVNESLEVFQVALITLLIAGLAMISLRSYHFSRKAWLERGVLLAIIGTVFMGATNFLVGFGSRVTSPLLTNWFIDIFLMGVSFFYIFSNKRLGRMVRDFSTHKKLVLSVSFLDNIAWIFFAFAASLIPIALALALSESYIALAALLGFLISKEKLLMHQKAGLIIALLSGAALTVLTM